MRITDNQPAWLLRSKDEGANVLAVRRLIDSAPVPESLYEFFGGMGGMTTVLRERFPGIPIESWDKDPRCVASLVAIPGVLAVEGDSLDNCYPGIGSGVLMDFNLWTLLRARTVYRNLMARVFASGAKWVHVTDSSLSKLHLNYSRYGAEGPEWRHYRMAVSDWARAQNWTLVGEEKAHSRAVMLLFRPLASRKVLSSSFE